MTPTAARRSAPAGGEWETLGTRAVEVGTNGTGGAALAASILDTNGGVDMEKELARSLLEASRARLLTLHRQLAGHLDGSDVEAAGELSPIDQHQADMGTDVFEHEKDLSVSHLVDDELRDLDEALDRLARGHYGRCEHCGRPIDDDRLEAVPATRFCADDQALGEGYRMTVPGEALGCSAPTTDESTARIAMRNVEFLPAEDESSDELDWGPEERAIHTAAGSDVGQLEAP